MNRFLAKSHHSFAQRLVQSIATLLLLCMPVAGLANTCTHPSSTWKTSSEDIITGIIFENYCCDTCGESTDTRMKNMRLNDGRTFTFTPNEFKKRFDGINSVLVKHYNDSKFNTLLTSIDDGVSVGQKQPNRAGRKSPILAK